MSVSNEPGRGRKQCGNCQKYVGVRSRVCPNCGTVFGSSLGIRRETVVPAVLRSEPVLTRVIPKAKTEASDDSKGSRTERINYLKRELIKELKISSRAYGAEIIQEISKSVLAE